tara:strand:- start:115 stop:519 length:405 start_codon:yes stop_codon:yes gene_type:complete
MKTILIAITLMLGLTSLGQSDSEFRIGAIWKVDVVEYNNDNEETDHYITKSACDWVFNLDTDTITYTEYTFEGEIIKQEKEYVEFNEIIDGAAMLRIRSRHGGTYNAIFWVDFSMVAYEFIDGYTIMSPSEDEN